ncbi:MAG: hypothetical protein JWQ53_2947, partial [Klenkia sp.]|nr:hypothetical protein [Klenkia sp.]
MNEQNRPADATGHEGDRYPTQGLPPQRPHGAPAPQVPPHQGWTGQPQPAVPTYATANPGLPPVFVPPQPARRTGR